MAKRTSPLLRLGRLDERKPLGFSWRTSESPVETRDSAIQALKAILGEYADWQGFDVNFNPSKTPSPLFGFHTPSAEVVWKYAKKIADRNPKETTAVILSKAIERSKIPVAELTPEDSKMLDMAVNWYLAGKLTGNEPPTTKPYGGNNVSGTEKNFGDSGSLT